LAHAPQWVKDQNAIVKTYEQSGQRTALLRTAQLMERTHSADFDGIWAAFAYGGVQDGTSALRCLERTLQEKGTTIWGFNYKPRLSLTFCALTQVF
jgi:hypothetical protein